MFKFVGDLFSKDKAAGTLDRVFDGIDSAVYTPQERADMRVRLLEVLAPFKVVQRILVSLIMSMWWLICLNFLVALWVKAGTEGAIDVTPDLIALIKTEFVWVPVAAAVGLYLGGGFMESRNRKQNEKT